MNIRRCQSMSHLPMLAKTPTETGWFSGLAMRKVTAKMNSFQPMMKAYIAVATSPGTESGRIIRKMSVILKPGDVVRLSEGQIAAADMRLIESQSLRVDTSYLTGESIPALRNSRSDPTGESVNARNLLFAGTKLVSGSATGVVFATGGKTEFAKIADLTGSDKPLLSPLETEINITGKRIALIALAVGLLFFVCSIAAGLGLKMAIIFAVGLIVANIPEGLMPTMTLSLAVAAQRMAKKKSSSDT
mgnify:CR=1 FL=1